MTHTGFFERYFITPFFRKYSDFGGVESRRAAWLSIMAWLIVTSGVAGVLFGQVGLLGPEVGFICVWVLGGLWLAGSVCPMAALIRRAMKSDKESEPKPVRFLGIDKLLSAICVCFLILGILMAIVTLNSSEINPYHRGNGDGNRSSMMPQEEIVEEPIFTYQDATPAPVENDPLDEPEEVVDSIILDESFDPQIAVDATPDTLALN